MKSDLKPLMEKHGIDVFFIHGKGQDSFYLTNLEAVDPYHLIRTKEKSIILLRELELERAKRESKNCEPSTANQFGLKEATEKHKGKENSSSLVLAELFKNVAKDQAAGVFPDFPVGIYNALKELDVNVKVIPNIVSIARETKEEYELENLMDAQKKNEEVMRIVIDVIKNADIVGNELQMNGETLTSAKVKEIALRESIKIGVTHTHDLIVSPGKMGALPHHMGTDKDILRPNEAIVVDIYPKSKNQYCGDMTRTVSRGEPSPEIVKMYDIVLKAQQASIDAVKAGVTCGDVNDASYDIIEAAGYETLRSNHLTQKGLIHGVGHGIGLDIHEAPSIVHGNSAPLKKGQVFSVEPGLYDTDVGGIRLEDLIYFDGEKAINLNKFEKQLII